MPALAIISKSDKMRYNAFKYHNKINGQPVRVYQVNWRVTVEAVNINPTFFLNRIPIQPPPSLRVVIPEAVLMLTWQSVIVMVIECFRGFGTSLVFFLNLLISC